MWINHKVNINIVECDFIHEIFDTSFGFFGYEIYVEFAKYMDTLQFYLNGVKYDTCGSKSPNRLIWRLDQLLYTAAKLKNSPWYPGTNGCHIIGSDKLLVQRRTTDRQTDRQTKRVYR